MGAQALRARGGAAPVTVQMVPGTEVQFRATWRDLQTFCIVSVRDVRGLVVARRLDRLETTSVWLAPGSYTIETFDPTFARREQKITVAKVPLQIRVEGQARLNKSVPQEPAGK